MARFDSLVHATPDGRWMNLRCDGSFGRLCDELDRAQVSRACLVGLPGVIDNTYVLDCARATGGRFVPVAGFDPCQQDGHWLAEGVGAIADAGFGALKLHPRLNGYDPLDPRCLTTICEAGRRGLVVFLDTLFRQRGRATTHAADVIDRIANSCGNVRIVLLHSGGPALLEVGEVVRLHADLVLDLSFTLLRYAGTSLDSDIRWTMEHMDQRVVIGSDMPEFTPSEAFARADVLAAGLSAEKQANITHRNLDRLFPDAVASSV